MNEKDVKIKLYDCCFCRGLMDSLSHDLCEIDILLDFFNKTGAKEWARAYYAHIQCFEERLHENVREHFVLGYLVSSKYNEEIGHD